MNKTAIVFPGQGAQKIGMCFDFYEKFDAVKKIFDSLDASVKKIIFEGSQESLNQTLNAQPALFAADLACAAALKECGVNADGAAGFSLGEIPALVYCGVFDFAAGLEFVNFRARVMQNCAEKNKGGMAAVMGLSAEKIVSLCAEIDGAFPANFNSATQTVVAFSENSFEELSQAVSSQKGKLIKLAVSGAFHSPLMNEAADEIKNFLREKNFNDATKPIYSNVTAQVYGDPRDLLARHVNSPVKWFETIENMVRDGYGTFIEAGPGKTLAGLIQKINPAAKVFNVFDLQSLEGFVKCFRT
jgi:[acyl-carrier-protein] S-malonyltransferase